MSSCTVADAEALGASAKSLTGNGPARRPPGPFVRVRLPLMSSVRRPVLWTTARTSGAPVLERSALSEPIAKFAGSAPPVPIETYIRTPTRFTSVTPPPAGAGADTSAQTTA